MRLLRDVAARQLGYVFEPVHLIGYIFSFIFFTLFLYYIFRYSYYPETTVISRWSVRNVRANPAAMQAQQRQPQQITMTNPNQSQEAQQNGNPYVTKSFKDEPVVAAYAVDAGRMSAIPTAIAVPKPAF